MKSTHFTKREIIVLIVFCLLIPLTLAIPPQLRTDYEILFLLFVVTPIGVLIATDPERRK